MATPPPAHGPFGDKAFRVALRACGLLIVAGAWMTAMGDGPVASVGTSLLVLGGLGAFVGLGGLLLERVLAKRDAGTPKKGDSHTSRRFR
jgi:membrane associated rhomboid family serine protease